MWLGLAALVCFAGYWLDAQCPWEQKDRRQRTRERTRWERTNKAL